MAIQGDVCGKVLLTPMAIATGRKLAHRLFEPRPQYKQDFDTVPSGRLLNKRSGREKKMEEKESKSDTKRQAKKNSEEGRSDRT